MNAKDGAMGLRSWWLIGSASLLVVAGWACATDDADNESAKDPVAAGEYGEVDDDDDTTASDNDDDTDAAVACDDFEGTEPVSRALEPLFDAEYYAEQSSLYFDTIDIDSPLDLRPEYAELVARWEWPPWWKLTAYTRDAIEVTDRLLRILSPSTIPERDCRFFAEQPFGRCHVVFYYDGEPCPIYEEFTFNNQGEVTFVEAWSDIPGLLPYDDPEDAWAEGEDVNRLSTRIPGLGKSSGRIDVDGACMAQVAAEDADVADFVKRAHRPWFYWTGEYFGNPESFAQGCGWETR
ncbi:MAG: hypothetical protein H6683_00455 [Deltaproteobacteria bacterium]|nr:hypothetical protein [Deltaproteobacteria bacterium]